MSKTLIVWAILVLVTISAGSWGVIEHNRATSEAASLDDAQASLSKAEAQIITLNSQVANLQTRIAQISNANSALEQKVTAESKLDLPISVSFRKAVLGPGLVASFRNNSGRAIEVAVRLVSQNTGQQRQAQLVLAPGQTQEIGYAQGWQFTAGQRIGMENENFRPMVVPVP